MAFERILTMAEADEWLRARISRRTFIRAAAAAAATGPVLLRRPGRAAMAPAGAHLTYGADPRTQAVISWLTTEPVQGAVADVGLDATYGSTVAAETRTVAGSNTLYHHAPVGGLAPGTTYHYRLRHDGATGPDVTFRTAPAMPEPFTFTAFGDQGTSAAAAAATSRVGAQDPAFHFHVGDLCYANRYGVGDPFKPADLSMLLRSRATDQPVWDTWFTMNAPVAAGVPWMPAVGNHEMEYGYGPQGYDGYLARFTLPANGAAGAPVTYSFRYGNVGVIALDANDASEEIPSNRGYAGAAQDAWLAATLAGMRAAGSGIDFIVIGYHHCAYCTNVVHASDGGVRERWGKLMDDYAVDLVINGHNHCYERTHPIRGGAPTKEVRSGETVSPAADGTTYITAGGGGQVAYQASLYPASYVSILGARVPEPAPWSAYRYLDLSLLAIDVVPTDGAGRTTMTVRALRPDGSELERVILVRNA